MAELCLPASALGPNYPRWDPRHGRSGRNILDHHRPRADDGMGTNFHARHNLGPDSDEGCFAYFDSARQGGCGADMGGSGDLTFMIDYRTRIYNDIIGNQRFCADDAAGGD